jgi:hypothetical protein
MAVTTKPEEYRCTDGQTYSKKEDAERHEELIAAQREFESARRKFGQLLARTQKTADGETFDFRSLGYFFVSEPYLSLPRIHRVSFDFWHFEFDHEDKFQIRQKDEDGVTRSYSIDKLYRDEENAKVALLAAQEEWLAMQVEIIDSLKKSLKTSRAR